MIIETKFNIGDTVWYSKPFLHKAEMAKITTMRIHVLKDRKPLIQYNRGDGSFSAEGELYKTREDAEKAQEEGGK